MTYFGFNRLGKAKSDSQWMSPRRAAARVTRETVGELGFGLRALARAGVLLILVSTLCAAQITKDPEQIKLGRAMFRNACAPCHGIGAQGGRGPDLTRGHFNNGDTDADLYRVISRGVPGTRMPAVRPDLIDSKGIWLVVSFIRSVAQAETLSTT